MRGGLRDPGAAYFPRTRSSARLGPATETKLSTARLCCQGRRAASPEPSARGQGYARSLCRTQVARGAHAWAVQSVT